MFYKTLQNKTSFASGPNAADFILKKSSLYLESLQRDLDLKIDKRLVRTFYNLFNIILLFRNRAMGLLLSELGGYLCGFRHAPAGTKRISNLLRSKKWDSSIIDDFLFERTQNNIEDLLKKKKRPLLLWDDSRIEKPESWFSQGLCSVHSSKGKRLTRIKSGFFFPPTQRICVPGFKWTGILLSNLGGVPSVCMMSWWTTRGKFKEHGTNIIFRMLKKINEKIGQKCLHVLDRGYANTTMLEWLFSFEQDFVIRWKKNHLLNNKNKGTKKTHLLARSFKPKNNRLVHDKERKKFKRISISWAPVEHLEYPDNQLYLIIVRDKNNFNSPMYLITSIEIKNAKQAWEICFCYFHRWNIEQAFRFGKSELGMESPRLWFWENRLKLMAIVSLVYDFILSLLRNWKLWTAILFRNWCHRTGNRYRNASIPIYRLRMAISNCLLFYLAQNSG